MKSKQDKQAKPRDFNKLLKELRAMSPELRRKRVRDVAKEYAKRYARRR